MYCVNLCSKEYNEEMMVSSRLVNYATHWVTYLTDVHQSVLYSSQIYPLLNHSLCDAMCNEEWSELMHNLRELPGGFLQVCVMFHSGEMIRFAIG